MSFLFTFRLPRLPFPNPFATPAAEEEDSGQNLATGSNRNTHLRVPDASRVSRVNAPSSSGFQSGFREEDDPITNSRKRNRTSLNENSYTITTQNAYRDNLRNNQGSPTRITRVSRRREYEYDSAEDNERPEKRRKVGIAETILSTAVSVAIVSTAVGYTAYRLWRDGGSTSGVNTKDDETETLDSKKESAADWQDGPARDTNNNQNISGIASPPPPYYATYEDSWTGYGDGRPRVQSGRPGETSTSMGRAGGRYSTSQQDYPAVRPGSKRGPMAKVHRTLKTSSSPRSNGRQTGHQYEGEGVYGRKKAPGLERDERLASPTGQKQDGWRSVHEPGATNRHANLNTEGRRRATKPVAVVRSDSEEYEEGSSRLEEQMDWMSERLRGLIADGKKALGREIVVAEGVADSPLHGDSDEDGMGHLDDGEGGWEDAEDNQNNPASIAVVVRHRLDNGELSPGNARRIQHWDNGIRGTNRRGSGTNH